MAEDTKSHIKNLVIYEVYIRNHGDNGNFSDVEADLERIRGMGVDVIWLMPIHPIGKIARKGSLGSPYSIVDYRAINPEYGTKEDFAHLIETAHNMGLKVWIDVVYNHTAHDSKLVAEHPNWFHQDEAGKPLTTVPDWSDVIDLKHPNEELTKYLIDTLKGWVEFGVDGFRCDVASLLPRSFWVRARNEIQKINPDILWLAESVHAGFISYRRSKGLQSLSDSEIYDGFDITYDYDIWPIWQAAVTGHTPVARYLEMLRFQDCIYPANYVKLRCVENHDQRRIMALAASSTQALAWTAFQSFNKGAFLIYGGQESAATHTPSLFEIDKVDWKDYPLQDYITRLAKLKKDPAMLNGNFIILASDPVVQATWHAKEMGLYGVFNTSDSTDLIEVSLPDGDYLNELSGETILVREGRITPPETAFILRYSNIHKPKMLKSLLLDFHIPVD
jgi:hypothetical protein